MGLEEREWERKGQGERKTHVRNFQARGTYFSFKIKNTNQFHSTSKSRNEWGIWLVMFRNKWFLEIDCDFKNESFCFFKIKKNSYNFYTCTSTSFYLPPHPTHTHTPISCSPSLFSSCVALRQAFFYTAVFWIWALSSLQSSLPTLLPLPPQWHTHTSEDSPSILFCISWEYCRFWP